MLQLAQSTNRWALRLVYAAIVAFMVTGTLYSLNIARDQTQLALEYLPLALVVCSMPCSLFCGFLLVRLGISNARVLFMMFITATVLLTFSSYFGMAAWLGIPFVLKSNLKKYQMFLADKAG
ncbi:MAG: hypothetical protein VXW65_15605 [Pseudomonadota bacterium]|nr:hypothetical protein [Pseudomonadota bacterium]